MIFKSWIEPFRKRKEIEVKVETPVVEEIEEITELPVVDLWEKIQNDTLDKFLREKVSKALATSCYSKEELDDTKECQRYLRFSKFKDHEDTQVIESTQEVFVKDNSELYKALLKKYPKVIMCRKNLLGMYHNMVIPQPYFNRNKIVDILTEKLKKEVHEFENSQKTS